MSNTKARGRFYWYDLFSPDIAGAINFYTKVVGWGSEGWHDGDPNYKMWANERGPMGGVVALGDELKKAGVPPHWLAYVVVPDVDKTASQIKKLGGELVGPPRSLPTVGSFATFRDPWGAMIAAFTPEGEADAEVPSPISGSVSWNELATDDSEAAMKFYGEVFGWEPSDSMDMGNGWIYRMYRKPGMKWSLGGMFNRPKEMPANAWMHYIRVSDLDASVKAIEAGGGTVLMGPHDVPGGNKIVQAMDPQGAMFALDWSPEG